MSITTSDADDDRHDDCDDRLHEAIKICTRQIMLSQRIMLLRIEASIKAGIEAGKETNARVEASSAGTEALLSKVVESQAQHQQVLLRMWQTLANNSGISNEAAGNIPIATNDRNPNVVIKGGQKEEADKVVENSSSEANKQQEDAEANQEDDQANYYDFDGYQPLVEAIDADDWNKAKKYLDDHKTAIKGTFETRDSAKEINYILRAAAYSQRWMFVAEIVKLAPAKALEFANPKDLFYTILHLAAIFGKIKVVKALVEKNPILTQIGMAAQHSGVPLALALVSVSDGQKEVLEYLYSVTRHENPSPFTGSHGAGLLVGLLEADMYGIVLSICQRVPELVKSPVYLLELIVGRPFAFKSGAKLNWWERYIYSLIDVDMDGPHYGMDEDSQKLPEGITGSKVDEENPPQTSQVSSMNTGPHLTNKRGTVTNNISAYFMRHMKRVPLVRKLYDQKLMHKQVNALVRHLLTQLAETANEEQVKYLFRKYNILETAIKFGTTELVLECLGAFPFLCLDGDMAEMGALIQLVIRERNETVYSFICILKQRNLLDGFKRLDGNNNSILHVCAELPHNRQLNIVSGAAFQMQREIQWFKGVEMTMLQKERYTRNKNGDTAHLLFTERHADLMEKGEKWMKDTSGSCMVVAALIATVAFAAAITVPGGSISDSGSSKNGLPVFLDKKSFMVFAITDALALFSSITSVLMFLTVFTSRYSEEDFLKSLPQKIIIGLVTLFISMATMLVAFGAAFIIVVGQRSIWAPITVSLLGCAPVLLFGFLQFPLFFEMVCSTYWPIVLGKDDNPLLEPYFPKEKKD